MATNNTESRNKAPLIKVNLLQVTSKVQTKSSHPAALVTQNQDCLLQKAIPNDQEVSFSSPRFETKIVSSVDHQLKMTVASDMPELILNIQKRMRIIEIRLAKHDARILSLLLLATAENLQLKASLQKNQDTAAALQIQLVNATDPVGTTQNQDHDDAVAKPDLLALSPRNNLLSSNAFMNPATSCPLSGPSEALGSQENDDTGVTEDVPADKKIRPPPGYWKEHFWTQELQDLVAERDRCYRRWRHANGMDCIIWYIKRRDAQILFRKAVQTAKRDAYKKYLSEVSEL